MNILRKLEIFHSLGGYLGAGVFTPEGQMLAGVTDVAGTSFEITGKLFHDAFLVTDNYCRETGFGCMDFAQLHTEKGIIFLQCFNEGETHFHVILVVKPQANVALAKLQLGKVIDVVKQEFLKEEEKKKQEKK